MFGKKRDVQLHAAVTIMNRVENIEILGEAPNEIAQFAVQLDSKFAPFTDRQVRMAFDGLYVRCLERMRAAGLLRAGS